MRRPWALLVLVLAVLIAAVAGPSPASAAPAPPPRRRPSPRAKAPPRAPARSKAPPPPRRPPASRRLAPAQLPAGTHLPVSFYASGVAAAQQAMGLSGAGVRIAILDSGINYEHPVFGSCSRLGDGNGRCRVVNGYDYMGDISFGAPKRPDSDPMDCKTTDKTHGTQVASVAAGDASFLPHKAWRGVAYRAGILAYKVSGGCQSAGSISTDASIEAVRRAVDDGAGVLNLSFGDFRAGGYPSEGYSWAMTSAMRRGTLVSSSAGNMGPFGPFFVEGGISAPGGLTVAAADVEFMAGDHTLTFSMQMRDGGNTLRAVGPLLTPQATLTEAPSRLQARQAALRFPLKIVLAEPLKGCGVSKLSNERQIRGNLAFVERSDCPFEDKVNAAAAAGAAAVIVFNDRLPPYGPMSFEESPALPSWGVESRDGRHIAAAVRAGQTVYLQSVRPAGGQQWSFDIKPSSFSSWGPSVSLTLSPTLMAPGQSLHAASAGGDFTTVWGTSYSSAFVAGALAVWRQARGSGIPRNEAMQKAARAAFVSTAKPVAWAGHGSWVEPVGRVGAGFLQLDAAISNPVLVDPEYLGLRSNLGSQKASFALFNAADFPVTYRIGHAQAPAISHDDIWYADDPQRLLTELAASAQASVGGRAPAGEVTVPARGKAFVEVTFTLPWKLRAAPYVYSGYVTLTPTSNTAAVRAPAYAAVPLVVPYQGFSQNYTTAPILAPRRASDPSRSAKLASQLRVCYADFSRDFLATVNAYRAYLPPQPSQDGLLSQSHVDACLSRAGGPTEEVQLPLSSIRNKQGVVMVSAALVRPALRMQLMLFETYGGGGGKPYGRGDLLGEVWRLNKPPRNQAGQMYSFYGKFDGSSVTSLDDSDREVGRRQVVPGRRYRLQLWVVAPLAAVDRAAGERYHTWKHDVPGTYVFK